MEELTDKITIQESNLADTTKREYCYRLKQFYGFAPIKTEDELIDCPSDERYASRENQSFREMTNMKIVVAIFPLTS